MTNNRDCHVYLHHRKTDGRVFYVGKGKKSRATNTTHRSEYWKRVYAKHGRTVRYIARNIPEPCALSFEMALISAHGRPNLCNLSDGGDGVSNPTDAHRAIKSAAFSASKNPAYDKNTYNFWHEGYGFVSTTKINMRNIFSIGSSALARVVNGGSWSAKGWMLTKNKGRTPGKKCGPNNATKATIETYINVSGKVWTGNPSAFCTEFSLNKTNVYKMRAGIKSPYKGWSRA
jgi:hypothetical protein